MAKYPGMTLWTDAYLGDTQDLSLEEHGAYLMMLMIAWRSPDCKLPDDDLRLARMLRISLDRWRHKIRPVMERYWKSDGEHLVQKRLKVERARTEEKTKKRKTAAQARWLKNNDSGNANASQVHMQNGCKTHATHTHTHTHNKNQPTNQRGRVSDECLFVDHFLDLRERLWDASARGNLPTNRLGLESQARGFLEEGLDLETGKAILTRYMTQHAGDGRDAPRGLNAYRLSLRNGIVKAQQADEKQEWWQKTLSFEEKLRTRMREYREMGYWFRDLWGPKPGEPKCEIPGSLWTPEELKQATPVYKDFPPARPHLGGV